MKYFALSLCFLLASCRTPDDVNNAAELPAGASLPVNVGNGWYEFKYKNRCYAYTLEASYGFNRQTAIFEVECEKPLTPAQ